MRNSDPSIIQCPHCGELIDIPIETNGSPTRYVIDCSVCCRPIVVQVEMDDDGLIRVDVARESD